MAVKFNLQTKKESDATKQLLVLNLNGNDKENCLTGIVKINDNLIMLLDSKKIIDADEMPQILSDYYG